MEVMERLQLRRLRRKWDGQVKVEWDSQMRAKL